MIQTFTSVHPRQTAAVTFSFNIWNSLFCGPPSSHFPLENKDFFLNFNIESRLNVVQLLQDRYSVTSNMKTGLFSFLFELLLSSFFFPALFSFPFFVFFLMLPTQKTPSLPPFFSLFSSPLPAGFLLQLLVLPHFLCVFVLQDTHRNIRVISIHEYISINEGGETLAEQLLRN